MGQTKETNALWESLIPGANGWVQFHDPRRLNLAPGLPANDPAQPSAEYYSITWGHQYHCLKQIRKAFWEMVYKGSESPLVGADMYGQKHGDRTPEGKETPVGHLMHCFDYLRQTLECQSDLTLENRNPDLDATDPDVNGYNVRHQCKSKV